VTCGKDFSWIQDLIGVERLLNFAHRFQGIVAKIFFQKFFFEQTDAMFSF
jgi:cytochrome b subunit of formate dehydrogenase